MLGLQVRPWPRLAFSASSNLLNPAPGPSHLPAAEHRQLPTLGLQERALQHSLPPALGPARPFLQLSVLPAPPHLTPSLASSQITPEGDRVMASLHSLLPLILTTERETGADRPTAAPGLKPGQCLQNPQSHSPQIPDITQAPFVSSLSKSCGYYCSPSPTSHSPLSPPKPSPTPAAPPSGELRTLASLRSQPCTCRPSAAPTLVPASRISR